MSAIQMRGYVLLSAVDYLRKAAGGDDAGRILGELGPQTQRSIETAKQATWCPAEDVASVFRAIAALSKGDEARARDNLIECGQFAARDASNTFLKLLMKLLTPAMFAKKLPDVWARDCTGGKIAVDLQADRITNHLTEMGGFDHIAPVCVGFVKFGLEAMGKSITKTTLQGWSLQQPAPDAASFEICWKA